MQRSTLSLETILAVSADKMQQLLHILKTETAVLKNNNIEELEAITQKKITLTEEIEKNEQLRFHFLTKKSLNPDKPTEWLDSNKLMSIWQELKKLAEQSKKQNQINGLVINGNRNRIQTQIEILSGSSLPSAELEYSSSGERVKQRNSNTLALA